MTTSDNIKDYLEKSDSNIATVSYWGEGSVNGRLKIDCGKFAVMKELRREIKVSNSTLYRAIKKLKDQKIIRICNKRPMLINLIEK